MTMSNLVSSSNHAKARTRVRRIKLLQLTQLRLRSIALTTFVATSLTLICAATANKFDPYQMNGGLVAAVAGRDYVAIACDTRMMGEGGYDILERDHLRSRLWVAAADRNVDYFDEFDAGDATIGSSRTSNARFTAADGSVQLGDRDLNKAHGTSAISALASSAPHHQEEHHKLATAPILVASAGCSADCEMLKRTIRADVIKARYFGECSPLVAPHHVATLLSQVLYARRGFPFYSFCVLAGLDVGAGGRVYAYDAIGSYEQVAVATAGTGRELLQPILDRKFQSFVLPMATVSNEEHSQVAQEVGGLLATAMRPATVAPCSKMVSCSADTAVENLVQSFRDVSEREIGVGDSVVVCVLRKTADGSCDAKVYRYPLKTH
ncbi:hypothetical protein MPSEU_000167400 [Mayamaea pseudoterrestris]|nr:hypothetical protein MPSEU_000167400 [Mayamaea pseudoterrestris]